MKDQIIERFKCIRDCAIENAEDLYSDEFDEMYPNQSSNENIDPSNPHVWYKVCEDARRIDAVIDAIKALDESWVKELVNEILEMK